MVSNGERLHDRSITRGGGRLGNLDSDAWVDRFLFESLLLVQPISLATLQDTDLATTDPYPVIAFCVTDDKIALVVCCGYRVPYFDDCYQELLIITKSRKIAQKIIATTASFYRLTC